MRFYTDVSIHRGNIVHSGYDNGKKFTYVENYEPTLAIECNEETGYKTIYGNNAKIITFDSISEFKQYNKNYKDSIDLLGNISPIYQYIGEHYPDEMSINTSIIRTLIYDIETIDDTKQFKGFPKPEQAPVPVVSISIKDIKNNTIWLFSLKEYDEHYKEENINVKKINHRQCSSEFDLLTSFVNLIQKLQPDLLIGYNNSLFDDPYILNRIEKICGRVTLKKLSPINDVHFEFYTDKYGDSKCRYNIKGLQILDYLTLYKKFIPAGRESYSLSAIAQEELGEDKVDYSDHENIIDFYIEDPLNFQYYNIMDTELIHRLDKKLGLLDLVYTIAYMAKINYEDIMSPIRTWDTIIYEHLKEQNIVIPPDKMSTRVSYAGAYVHDPKPGIYDWVVSYDLNSLYPHLIMQYNISPECIVNEFEVVNQNEIDDKLVNKEIKSNPNYILSGSGQYFKNDIKGFLPILMENLYNGRVEVKNEMKELKQKRDNSLKDKISALNNKQLAMKILLNSCYGGLASPYFRYFDIRLAKSITLSGQLAIKFISNNLSKFLFKKYKVTDKFLYGDTDSIYMCFDFVAKKFNCSSKKMVDYIHQFSQKIIEPKIDEIFTELKEYVNANEQKMVMKQEKISEKFLQTGKKRYATLVWDDEGFRYNEPELKVTGLEIVRSSTPKKIKPYMKQSIITLMKDQDAFKLYIEEVKKEFYTWDPEEIAFPRSVSNVKQYVDKNKIFGKGCPIGVRAALIFNKYIQENKIDMEEIHEGEKIKFFYSLVPNVFYNSNVFGYINRIPNRDEIVKYIDYKTQFDKVYLNVFKEIAKKINIEIEEKKQTSLDDLF